MPRGEQGVTGTKGSKGKEGVIGLQGYQGPKGEIGEQGETGESSMIHKGSKGDDGSPGDPTSHLHTMKIFHISLINNYILHQIVNNEITTLSSNAINIDDPLYGLSISPGSHMVKNNSSAKDVISRWKYNITSTGTTDLKESLFYSNPPFITYSQCQGELDTLYCNIVLKDSISNKITDINGNPYYWWIRVETHRQAHGIHNYYTGKTLRKFSEWVRIGNLNEIINLNYLTWYPGDNDIVELDHSTNTYTYDIATSTYTVPSKYLSYSKYNITNNKIYRSEGITLRVSLRQPYHISTSKEGPTVDYEVFGNFYNQDMSEPTVTSAVFKMIELKCSLAIVPNIV